MKTRLMRLLTPLQRKKLSWIAECLRDGYDPRSFTVIVAGEPYRFSENDYRNYKTIYGYDPVAPKEATVRVAAA